MLPSLQTLNDWLNQLANTPWLICWLITLFAFILVLSAVVAQLRDAFDAYAEAFGDWPSLAGPHLREEAGTGGGNPSADFLSSSVLHGGQR